MAVLKDSNATKTKFTKFFILIGFDRDTSALFSYRIWSIIAGAITVIIIPITLDPIQQGYFYTFGSILAAQVFFELGLNQLVVLKSAHEAPFLHRILNIYEGSSKNKSHMAELILLFRRWYLMAALLFLLIVTILGLFFFKSGELDWHEWTLPWFILVFATSINMTLSWKLALVQGFSYVRDVAQLRLRQSLLGYLVMWTMLLMDVDLLAATAVPTIAAMVSFMWLKKQPAKAILEIKSNTSTADSFSWKHEIWPLQWRIALSFICGYFVFNLFVPLSFQNIGAVEAGKLGMALTVFAALSNVSMSWVTAKTPKLAMLISQNKSEELLLLFKQMLLQALSITSLLVAALLLSVWAALQIDLVYIDRIADLPILLCIGTVTIVNSFLFTAASFMRAHLEEPMLTASIVGGVIVIFIAWFGSQVSVLTMMVGYTIQTVFIGVPWFLIILKPYVKKHQMASI
jgi:hypothetical protein